MNFNESTFNKNRLDRRHRHRHRKFGIDYSSSSRNTIKESIENFNESRVNKDRLDGIFGWWDYSQGLDIGWYGNGLKSVVGDR